MTKAVSLFLVLCVTAIAAVPALADNHKEGQNEEDRYVRFKRPNLIVPDMDAALKFYVDHLGFKFAYAEDSAVNPESNYAYKAFNFDPTKAVRQATLHSSTEERAFALTEVVGLEAEISRTPSLTAMVIETKRFMDLREDLVDDGYTVTDYRNTSENGEPGILEMGVLDPAGHLIVVYQYVNVPEGGFE